MPISSKTVMKGLLDTRRRFRGYPKRHDQHCADKENLPERSSDAFTAIGITFSGLLVIPGGHADRVPCPNRRNRP